MTVFSSFSTHSPQSNLDFLKTQSELRSLPIYIFRILNTQNFLFPLLPQIFDFKTFRNKCRGENCKDYLFYVCRFYVKNTYCDDFIQIGGSLPFYELHVKEVPRVREKQYTIQYFQRLAPWKLKYIFLHNLFIQFTLSILHNLAPLIIVYSLALQSS